MKYVLKDLDGILPNPHVVHYDNMLVIVLSANPVFHFQIKHLDTNYHSVRERVQIGDLDVNYIPIDDQTDDLLTKGLHSPSFVKHCYNSKLENSN